MTRRRRGRLTGLVLAAIIVITAGLAIAIRLATYTPPEEPSAVTPEAAREAMRAVESLEQQLVEVKQAAQSGKRRPFKVSIGQQDVTNFLITDKHASSLIKSKKIDKPRVQFTGDSIVTSCYVTAHGRRVHVTVNGRLSKTPEGKMVFQSDRVLLGRLPAPGPIKSRVDRAINDYLSFGSMVLPAEVTGITSEDGNLTIKGISSPNAARH